METHKLNFAAYLELSNEEYIKTELFITKLASKWNMKRWEVISYIFKEGLEELRQEVDDEEVE